MTAVIEQETMIAFHGDEQLKSDLLAEIKRHEEQDQIIKGTYGQKLGNDWKGCAVGCSIHSLNRLKNRKLSTSNHQVYETEFGISAGLAYLEDGIFEGLPSEEATKFPYRFISAIPVGADLSLVLPSFLAWLLDDPEHGVIRFADDLGKVSIHQIADMHRQVVLGTLKPAESAAWSAARSAAWSAASSAASNAASNAADAARSAAWSAASSAADAAWSAAWSAASSAAWSAASSAASNAASNAADAARSAAWSAASSAADAARSAADAARSAASSAQSEKLLELLAATTAKRGDE